MNSSRRTPWKPQKSKPTEAEAFVQAAETLWTEESIRQTKELADQLLNPNQRAAA